MFIRVLCCVCTVYAGVGKTPQENVEAVVSGNGSEVVNGVRLSTSFRQ